MSVNPMRELLIFLRAVKPDDIRFASFASEIRLRGPGGEIVLYDFKDGGGKWYFNDTAD